MDKSKHTYEEDLTVNVEYGYNNKHHKIYNIEQIKKRFEFILESLKNKNNGENNE